MVIKNIELVKKLLLQNLYISDIKLEDNLSDLGIDSVDLVELILDIEHELNIYISENIFQDFKTIEDIVSYLDKQEI